MNELIRWALYGAGAGLLFPLVALAAGFVRVWTGGVWAPGLELWITLPAPLFAGLAGALHGRVRRDAAALAVEHAHIREQLENTEQQEEVHKLMKELSVYLDHLVDITNNIQEAICVVDRAYNIEVGYNKRFTEIFGPKDYAGRSVFDTIFTHLWGALKKEVHEFVDLCFEGGTTADSMLNDVNPVSKFTYLYHLQGEEREKVIKSRIVRIKNVSGGVENVMFIFDDVTLEERTEQEIQVRERAFQDELGIMTLIFKNDRDLVVDFINGMNDVIVKIQEQYQDIVQDAENRDILYKILGMAHLVKGEAFSLGFDEIATSAKEFETYIKGIAEGIVTLEQNLNIIEYYEGLYGKIDRVNGIARRLFSIGEGTQKVGRDLVTMDAHHFGEFKRAIQDMVVRHRENNLKIEDLLQFQKSMEQLNWTSLGTLRRELQLVSEKSLVQFDKKAVLNFIYDIDGLPESTYRFLKEVLIHLVRNSVAHGIEPPDERKRKNKEEAGRVNVHVYQENGGYTVLYSDDGAGFDLEKIRRKAAERGLLEGRDPFALSENETVGLVFKKGFSTAGESNMVAGVGIGMSAVRDIVVHSLEGVLRVKNRPDLGVSIKMSFPQ
jgi:PAS domain-containing protein